MCEYDHTTNREQDIGVVVCRWQAFDNIVVATMHVIIFNVFYICHFYFSLSLFHGYGCSNQTQSSILTPLVAIFDFVISVA